MYHSIGRTWANLALRIFGVKVHLVGFENLEKGTTYVYVSNHASMFDIPAVIGSIPDEVRIVYKKELAYVPIWGWALAVGHYISIDRFSAKDAMKLRKKFAKVHQYYCLLKARGHELADFYRSNVERSVLLRNPEFLLFL
jgi:1-acyl-sn-glycerol-3-phosphate acyltransferase